MHEQLKDLLGHELTEKVTLSLSKTIFSNAYNMYEDSVFVDNVYVDNLYEDKVYADIGV